MKSYEVYNAALQNGWTVQETAREFGLTVAEVRRLIDLAGGRVNTKGKVS